MPAKMAARRTDMKVKKAEAVPSFERALKVLGREQNQHIRTAIIEKTMVHWL